ncbi:hypothetical protein GGX14DRAFT_393409 [Mycena pura]|uniref:Uncharacterized protein n=1 Tax=Mycena pura TaxID=153505 RepID=A0AAD6YEI6_9AGAR|nr:hypothetical protein GGX14DRAFT_393409 [Mycena pura]
MCPSSAAAIPDVEKNWKQLEKLSWFDDGHTLWLNWAVTSRVPAGFNPYGFLKPMTKKKSLALQRHHYGKCQKPVDTRAELYPRWISLKYTLTAKKEGSGDDFRA